MIQEVTVVGGPLSRYRVVTPSGVESVIKYNQHDADQAGLTEDDLVDAAPRAAGDVDDPSTPPAKRRRTATNKARATSANKGARAKAAPSAPPSAPPGDTPPAGPSPEAQGPGANDGGPGGDD